MAPPTFPPSDLYYLAPGFPPSTLTVNSLREILSKHSIALNFATRKADLIDLFNENIANKRARILRTTGATVVAEDENESEDDGEERNRDSDDEDVGMMEEDNVEIGTIPQDLYYLFPGFPPTRLPIKDLKRILSKHHVPFHGAKSKGALIELFNTEIVPNTNQILGIETEGLDGLANRMSSCMRGGGDEPTPSSSSSSSKPKPPPTTQPSETSTQSPSPSTSTSPKFTNSSANPNPLHIPHSQEQSAPKTAYKTATTIQLDVAALWKEVEKLTSLFEALAMRVREL